MATVNYSKPLGIGAILAEGKNLFFDNISTYMKIFLVLMLAPLIAILLAGVTGLTLLIIPIYLIGYIIYFWGTIAMIFQIDKNISGDKKFDFDALRSKSSDYLVKYILAAIVIGILLSLLFMLLIIPGIIFAIFWVFAMYAILLKDKSVMESIKYSKQLVKGRWWSVLGYLIVFALFAALLFLPLALVALILSPVVVAAPILGAILIGLIYTAGGLAISVYFMVVQLIYFRNMDAMYGEKAVTKKK